MSPFSCTGEGQVNILDNSFAKSVNVYAVMINVSFIQIVDQKYNFKAIEDYFLGNKNEGSHAKMKLLANWWLVLCMGIRHSK